jgi:hypothetical protein
VRRVCRATTRRRRRADRAARARAAARSCPNRRGP